MTIAVTSPTISAIVTQGDPYSATISGTWSATNLGNGAVYLQVSDSANTFTLPAIQAALADGTFSYSLPLAGAIATGERAGTITVKACKDANCASSYGGVSGSITYRIVINRSPDTDIPQATVVVTSPPIDASISLGDAYTATISGTWSITNPDGGAVYLQVSDSTGAFAIPAAQPAPANNVFSYTLPLASGIGVGAKSGTITIKACKDAGCVITYPGTSGSVTYKIAVNRLPEPEPPQATIAITSPSITATISQGDAYIATVSGTWSVSNLAGAAVYLKVSDSAGTFAMPAAHLPAADGTFRYSLFLAASVAPGLHTGTITVKACKDAACGSPHAGTSGSVDYRVTVNSVPDWETVQGNASHNGYAPITLNPANIAKAWEWHPTRAGSTQAVWLGFPITGDEGVYVNATPVSEYEDKSDDIIAVEERTGVTRWLKASGSNVDPAYVTNLAYADGRIYYAKGLYTFNTRETYSGMIALQASNGATMLLSGAISQANATASPTPYAGRIYTSGILKYPTRGYVSIDGAGGAVQWSNPIIESTQGRPYASPSVDSQNVYYHSACCLEILNRQTGYVVASIPNPSADPTYTTRSLFSPTLLGTRGNVIALALTPTAGKRLLTSFNVANRAIEWTSALDYAPYPAHAYGVIYAVRVEAGHVSLHALNDRTGLPLWTWTAPDADGQYTQAFNVVATKNLIFFSAGDSVTQKGRLWAIDISTQRAVWEYPAYGQLAISAKRRLILNSNGAVSWTSGQAPKDDSLIAFNLD